MKISNEPTPYLLLKAGTDSAWDCCDFAIVYLSKEWRHIGQLHKACVIRTGQTDAAHGPVHDAGLYVLKAGEHPRLFLYWLSKSQRGIGVVSLSKWTPIIPSVCVITGRKIMPGRYTPGLWIIFGKLILKWICLGSASINIPCGWQMKPIPKKPWMSCASAALTPIRWLPANRNFLMYPASFSLMPRKRDSLFLYVEF